MECLKKLGFDENYYSDTDETVTNAERIAIAK